MSAMAYQITSLLEKMSSTDKDYRFMATNDLMVELQNDSIKLDEDAERKALFSYAFCLVALFFFASITFQFSSSL